MTHFKTVLFALALPLGGCATTGDTWSRAGLGAALGGGAGAAVSALTGSSALTGAAIGAVVGGGVGAATGRTRYEGVVTEEWCSNPSERIGYPVPGIPDAVWVDRDTDGCSDGYVKDGRYHLQPSLGAAI